MTKEAEEQLKFIDGLGEFLDSMTSDNDRCVTECTPTSFHRAAVLFKASYYLRRIATYSRASPCCLIASLLYIQRMQQRRPELVLSSRTLQRLLLVATMTATKYLEDQTCLNSRWAEIGGLPLRELNQLELEFLFALDFDLSVHPQQYALCAAQLPAAAATPSPSESCAGCCGGERRQAAEQGSGAESPAATTATAAAVVAASRQPLKGIAGRAWAAAAAAGKLVAGTSPAPRGPESPAAVAAASRQPLKAIAGRAWAAAAGKLVTGTSPAPRGPASPAPA